MLRQLAVLLVSRSGLITLNTDRKALGIVSFCAFDHRIVPVRRCLNGVLAFLYAGCVPVDRYGRARSGSQVRSIDQAKDRFPVEQELSL